MKLKNGQGHNLQNEVLFMGHHRNPVSDPTPPTPGVGGGGVGETARRHEKHKNPEMTT